MAMVVSIMALIISLLGIAISSGVAIYVYRKIYKQAEIHHKDSLQKTEIQHEDSLRENRINAVVDGYRGLVNSDKSSDIYALVQIGVANLSNEEEARETIKRIADSQGGRNPLSNKQKDIEEVGVLRFFQNITYHQLLAGKLDEVISNLRSTKK